MSEQSSAILPPVARGSDSAVLCVDDEPRALSALERSLGRESYEVLRASGGLEALQVLEGSPVKVVIADQQMPGMSGSELLTEIRWRWPHVGRIILTAYPGVEVRVRGLEAEVDFLMFKPWDDQKLRVAIRRLIEVVDRSRSEHFGRSGDVGWDPD